MTMLASTAIGMTALSLGYAQPVLAADLCAKIAGLKWAAPSDVRACFSSFPLNETIRSNIIESVSKTMLNFHTGVNYQIQAPPPFENDVHVDLVKEFARMREQAYPSYFAFHQDLQNTISALRDGHASYSNMCFDSLFVSYIPFPLVLAQSPSSPNGAIHIAPEAFDVASAEFADTLSFWQGLPGLSDLASFNGARVAFIDGQDPWVAVDKNAAIMGVFQSHATRQNGFFSSYIPGSQRGPDVPAWTYRMGDFAEKDLPIVDQVTLTVLKRGKVNPENVTIPFRARITADVVPFSDGPTFFANNCLATPFINDAAKPATPREARFQRAMFPEDPMHDQKVRVSASASEPSNIALPGHLTPGPSQGLSGGADFFMLDNTTAVLTLSSMLSRYDGKTEAILTGLQKLKQNGATRLIIDVTNNLGGSICLAHWLHRIIAGPNPNSVPQASLDTRFRAQELPVKIVKRIVEDNADPDGESQYQPGRFRFPNQTTFPNNFNYLDPGVRLTVNGRPDQFSVRLGQECQPFNIAVPPDEPLFDVRNVIIIGNGRCASSCSLFTIAMNIHYGIKTVVVGGKPATKQNYCGTVGGEASSFASMKRNLEVVGLQNDPLAPPDFLVSAFLGITWRQAFSILHPDEPEEWQDHPATTTYTPTLDTVNNPTAIWAAISNELL